MSIFLDRGGIWLDNKYMDKAKRIKELSKVMETVERAGYLEDENFELALRCAQDGIRTLTAWAEELKADQFDGPEPTLID